MKQPTDMISVVVPLFNEAAGIQHFHDELLQVMRQLNELSFEIIYVDDGSSDATSEIVRQFNEAEPCVKLVRLSRNFGKEIALTAGVAAANGDAILTIDGDGQHPVELIPSFIAAWREGGQVVVGRRTGNAGEGWLKRYGSRLFYRVQGGMGGQSLDPGATDYRLLDKTVQQAFLELTETDRITRGLIDWLGFERRTIDFTAKARANGTASYSFSKLCKLAVNSFVSLSPTPLYFFGYIGIAITIFAFLLGSSVFVEQLLLGDPLGWDFTGTAMLGIIILFLVGLVLLSQGVLSLYISRIYTQSKQRPLYVVDKRRSVGIDEPQQ